MARSKGFAYTVDSCERLLKAADEAAFSLLEKSFASDPRKGVQRALEQARRRLDGEARERRRIESLYATEALLVAERAGTIALGMDEVGRGALAGPLAVGGVILDPKIRIEGIDDSKRLSPALRERLAVEIEQTALGWVVCYVSARRIDQIGMAAALRLAFKRVIGIFERRGLAFDTVLVDGNPLSIDPREVNVVKGDRTCASIASASIVAKVHRDRLMDTFDCLFPGYDLARSKGYGTPDHLEAIRSLGLSRIHRQSFCPDDAQMTLFDEPL